MVVCFVLVMGGGPPSGMYGQFVGNRLWTEGDAFKNGFRGLCSVFVTAAFSYSGTELVGLAAAEARNPVKSLPGAIKQVFWRIILWVPTLQTVDYRLQSADYRLQSAVRSAT